MRDIIIIGGGAAGLTAGAYCAGAGLNVLLIEKQPVCGGQMCLTDMVENFPGLPVMSGFDIADKLRAKAKEAGTEIVRGNVTAIEKGDEIKVTVTGKAAGEYRARALVYAAGAVHRKTGVKGEEEFSGKGVSYCAVCDGGFYKGKRTAVIGGGDTALREALYLSGLCERVYLIHRRDTFRGQQILAQKCRERENITLMTGYVCREICGEKTVTGLSLTGSGGDVSVDVSGVFIAVGMTPETSLLSGICELDENAYVRAGEDCMTTAPGIFAAGDVRTKAFRQIITACADGANAAHSAEEYLNRL